jgi:hypothetical protein
MARKKRKPDGDNPQRRPQLPADLPDRRAIEGVMREFVAGLQGQTEQETPLDKAHAILFHAYQEPDEERRVQLAQDALVIKRLRRMWASDWSDEVNARKMVATTVTFEEEWDSPVADLEAAQKHGWQVVRPDAYPEVFHKERGLSLRPPLAWVLELLEGCLRAVPEFLTRHMQGDPAREAFTVPGASGQLKLVLSWVDYE